MDNQAYISSDKLEESAHAVLEATGDMTNMALFALLE